MYFEQFHAYFPEIAENETRSVTVMNDPKIPADTYMLTESYCADPDCDCRRVFLSAFSVKTKKIVAVIAFGWESERFYKKWLSFDDPEMVNEPCPCGSGKKYKKCCLDKS